MAKKNVLKRSVVSMVKQYGRNLRRNGIAFHQLIVFGSQAKGNAKPWSDIDVCVVSKQFGNDRHTERVQLMHIRGDALLDIEPHPYSPHDLSEKYDPLANEIRTYGIQIV